MSEIYISLCGGQRRSRRVNRNNLAGNVYVSLCSSKQGKMRLARGWGYRCFVFALVALMFLISFTIYPISLESETVQAAPGVENPSNSSITLTSEVSDTSVSLTPGAGFTLSDAENTAAYGVTTNNFTGYSIRILAADDDQTLVNTIDSSYTISSISDPINQTSFVYTNPALVNRWGIKPNKYYDTVNATTVNNNSVILPAPDTAGTILDITDGANTVANNYSVAIGAMVDGNKPSGLYTRTATLQIIPNPIYYTLNYDKNTTDIVNDLPSSQVGSTTTTSITMSSNTPTRTGYTFTGWCLGSTTTTDGVDSCTGTTFQPGDSFGIDQTVANTSTVYAMWKVNTYTITYGTTDGVASVLLDGGDACSTALSAGGCAKTLAYGQAYNLVATPATGHSFASWDAGDYGSIADATATGASTTYTVGVGDSTITPASTINQYTCTKQHRLQNADGTWGDYITDGTEQVDYGTTCSHSKTVANYKGSDDGINDSEGVASGTMTENGLTLQISMYRNTNTVTLTKGTGISAVSVTGTGVKSGSGTDSAVVYYGGDITIDAILTSGYGWSNWTGSATYTNKIQSIASVTSDSSYTANGASCSGTTNFSYTGNIQSFVATCTGTYKLETWGAQGGYTSSGGITTAQFTGYGGYAYGTYSATAGDKLYVVVGGQGTCGVNGAKLVGGYNGGGAGFAGTSDGNPGCTGGGATHIATATGQLYQLESNKNSILIVAGGGGGVGPDADYPGAGGGTYGGNGSGTAICNGHGGTQSGLRDDANCATTGKKCFGRGNSSSLYGGTGGGGYYGGDNGASDNVSAYVAANQSCTAFSAFDAHGGNTWSAGGGGGSGYLKNTLTNSGFYCYTGCGGASTTVVSAYAAHAVNKANSGNGYARITYLGNN